MWLSRAKKHKLSIKLEFSFNRPFVNKQSLVDVFLARCQQWQTLELSRPSDLIQYISGAINRLDRLEPLLFNDFGRQRADISTTFAAAPRLRSLRFANMHGTIPQLPWKQLQVLVIECILLHRCVNILKLASLLKPSIIQTFDQWHINGRRPFHWFNHSPFPAIYVASAPIL